MQKRCLWFFYLSIFSIAGCKSNKSSDLESIPTEPIATSSDMVRYSSVAEAEFCATRPAGECFSLILGIPSPQLEKNLALNTLALAIGAEKFRIPLLRACHKGLAAYAKGHQDKSLNIRNRLFSQIKETRCVIDFIQKETYETPELPQGQYAMATRLSDWNIKGETARKKLPPLTFEISSATLDIAYRNTMIFSKPSGEAKSKWSDFISKDFRPFGGFVPMKTRQFTLNFNGRLGAKFSTMETVEVLTKSLETLRDSEAARDSLKSFFSEASQLVYAIIAGDLSKGSMAVVALGIDAMKSMNDGENSKLKITSPEAIEAIKKSFGDSDVIDSETNALFSDSHTVLPAKLIDDAFWSSNGTEMIKALDLQQSSFEFDPALEDG